MMRDDPHDDVGAAARGEGDDEADLGWRIVGLRQRRKGECED
jgi:hypothetical protein